MPRVLLVLPSATYRASEFLAAAAKLGAEVVSGSDAPQAMADSRPGSYVVLPLDDPPAAAEIVASFAAQHPLDAVVAVDDEGLLVAGAAATRLGLAKNPYQALAATRDKVAMRRLLKEAGVAQPQFAVPTPGPNEPTNVAAAADALGYPAVVKPTSLAASRGVIRVDDHNDALQAARQARAVAAAAGCPSDRPLLVESFIPGDEVALEGLLTAGRLEVLAVFDKPDPLDGPYFEETIYVTPSRHPAALLGQLTATIERACGAIGLVDGPVHAEARLTPAASDEAARVVVLETAARTIGGKCASALRFAADRSLEEIVLAHALGLPVATRREETAAGVMMLPIPSSGRFLGIDGMDAARAVAGITGLEITVPVGRQIAVWPDGDRYLGFLFARGESSAAVENSLRTAHAYLAIRVEQQRDGAA